MELDIVALILGVASAIGWLVNHFTNMKVMKNKVSDHQKMIDDLYDKQAEMEERRNKDHLKNLEMLAAFNNSLTRFDVTLQHIGKTLDELKVTLNKEKNL